MRFLFSLIFVLSASTLSAQSSGARMYTSDSSQLSLFEMVDVKPGIEKKYGKNF
jgi:hypothetical protein